MARGGDDDGDAVTKDNALVGPLAEVLLPSLGPLTVSGVERLKGGYSRRMWAFDTVNAAGEPAAWVLCSDAADGVVGPDSLSRGREALLLGHVHAAGLPVPAIAAAGEGPEPFGADWFVMQRLGGTAAVGPLVRDPEIAAMRHSLGRQKAAILARVHRVPVPRNAFGPLPAPAEVAGQETQRWANALAQTPSADNDTMRSAVAHLLSTSPASPAAVCIVHGDYRTGNLLYDRRGILGVLDWEMAHPGDPLEDVAWAQLASWRVGTGLVGALLSDEDWIAAYAEASAQPVDRDALRFWQVLTGVKMSLLAWRAVQRTPPGKEHDLLRALFTQLQDQLRANLR